MTDSLHDAASGRRALRGAGQLRETLLQQAQGAAGVRLPVKGQALIKFAAVLDPHDEDLELSAAAAFGGDGAFLDPGTVPRRHRQLLGAHREGGEIQRFFTDAHVTDFYGALIICLGVLQGFSINRFVCHVFILPYKIA